MLVCEVIPGLLGFEYCPKEFPYVYHNRNVFLGKKTLRKAFVYFVEELDYTIKSAKTVLFKNYVNWDAGY